MIIDCDVHHCLESNEELLPFIPEPYRSEVAEYGLRQLASGIRYEHGGHRRDLKVESGGPTLNSPEYMRKKLLDPYGMRYVILTGQTGPVAGMPDPDYQAAICRAWNDYTISKWLPSDERFRMGIQLPVADPLLAAAEIERLGDHPGVVCALIAGTASRIPFGQRFYWPIYEAAERKNLTIHFHPSTTSVIANLGSTAAGMASSYLESHACLPQFYQAYVASFIFEGVFEKFPGLRVALIEGGVSWLVHLMWRMDKEFKALRRQAPFLKRLPSEYVRDHVRLGTQPMEEPKKKEHMLQIFDMIDAEHTLMYASDYPHFDFDEPVVLPKGISDDTRQRILHDNACEFFNLPPLPERMSAEVA